MIKSIDQIDHLVKSVGLFF